MSIEEDFPRLYEMYTHTGDPDLIMQACEIIRGLGAQNREECSELDKLIRFLELKNIGKHLLRYEDVYLLCSEDVSAVIYPDTILGSPYFRWASSTGFRSEWPRTLKGLLELIDYSWGMSQVSQR